MDRNWLGIPPNDPREGRVVSSPVRRGILFGLIILVPLLLLLGAYSNRPVASEPGLSGRSQGCLSEARRAGHDEDTARQMCAR